VSERYVQERIVRRSAEAGVLEVGAPEVGDREVGVGEIRVAKVGAAVLMIAPGRLARERSASLKSTVARHTLPRRSMLTQFCSDGISSVASFKKRTIWPFRSPSKRRSVARVTVRATDLTGSPRLEVSSFSWSIKPLIWSR
jgi:hypothetical protein